MESLYFITEKQYNFLLHRSVWMGEIPKENERHIGIQSVGENGWMLTLRLEVGTRWDIDTVKVI